MATEEDRASPKPPIAQGVVKLKGISRSTMYMVMYPTLREIVFCCGFLIPIWGEASQDNGAEGTPGADDFVGRTTPVGIAFDHQIMKVQIRTAAPMRITPTTTYQAGCRELRCLRGSKSECLCSSFRCSRSCR